MMRQATPYSGTLTRLTSSSTPFLVLIQREEVCHHPFVTPPVHGGGLSCPVYAYNSSQMTMMCGRRTP